MKSFLKRLGEWFSRSIILIDDSAAQRRPIEEAARGPYDIEPYDIEKDPELTYRVPDHIKAVPPAGAALRASAEAAAALKAHSAVLDAGGSVADARTAALDAVKIVNFGQHSVVAASATPSREPIGLKHPVDFGYIGRSPVEAALEAHDAARAAGQPPEAALEAAKDAATKARANAPNPVSKSPVVKAAPKAAPKAAKKSRAAPVVKKTTPAAPSGKKPSKRS